MTRLIHEWNNKIPLANVALLSLFIMPSILLQKPSKRSKSRDHAVCLERRLNLWSDGDFDQLIREFRAIQTRILQSASKKIFFSKRFSDLMLQGKVNTALKLFSNEGSSGTVPINDDVIKTLQEKHPETEPKFEELLLQGSSTLQSLTLSMKS